MAQWLCISVKDYGKYFLPPKKHSSPPDNVTVDTTYHYTNHYRINNFGHKHVCMAVLRLRHLLAWGGISAQDRAALTDDVLFRN